MRLHFCKGLATVAVDGVGDFDGVRTFLGRLGWRECGRFAFYARRMMGRIFLRNRVRKTIVEGVEACESNGQ